MELHGIHHITAITGDAPGNVEFYVGVLGLRLVKKTVNQDDPTVYHLFYADEQGSPGADLTFFEYPGVSRGLPGAGMVHRIVWRVGSADALAFWEDRLAAQRSRPADASLRFADPGRARARAGGLRRAGRAADRRRAGVPREHALQGFDAVRAYAAEPPAARRCSATCSASRAANDGRWEVRGAERGGFYPWDPAPPIQPIQGAGTVHHVAFASRVEEQEAWQHTLATSGLARPTPVIDRFYFRSIYFREPNGVLFEIATMGPGFATDEDPEHLGERLSLPPDFEHLRARSSDLTPLRPTAAEVR